MEKKVLVVADMADLDQVKKPKRSMLRRIADAIDAPPNSAPKKRAKLGEQLSQIARRWRHPFEKGDFNPLVAHDRTAYTWRPNGELRRHRLWLKGHAGKIQRKRYRQLRRGGHHSREFALAAVGIV